MALGKRRENRIVCGVWHFGTQGTYVNDTQFCQSSTISLKYHWHAISQNQLNSPRRGYSSPFAGNRVNV
jgi:hypothetical protein